MPSLMASSLHWRTHSARTNNVILVGTACALCLEALLQHSKHFTLGFPKIRTEAESPGHKICPIIVDVNKT
jgi:hypothetical protein